ncbi:MAG TPA: alkaline phosphatase family protein [Bryobacteraceae bacterium]|nr:alkaline phosphatase family protein [Bryobacteraceae bacterium]
MHKILQAAIMAFSVAALVVPQAYGDDGSGHLNNRNGIRRVLLISIDGMHALDYENCVNGGYCPQMAALGKHGVTYTRTSTSKPSDSFPGLMALVTGATPKTVGAFYDVAYDRVLAPPTIDTGNGVFGGTCKPGVANGTTTEFEEGVDFDQTQLSGGGPYANPIDGGIKSINPLRLPRDPFSKPACQPVYPWQFIRTNSIYGVIHAAGGYTAWSDKHAVYAAVSGHGDTANNVDDYYAPDVNSNVVGLPGVTTATGHSCATPTGSGAWTDDFQDIQCNDALKVNSILNEIDGKTHLGDAKAPVPNLFGMNFQAVSVGQKLIEGGVYGGYMDAAGHPTPAMMNEILFADASIGQMVSELKNRNLLDSTLIIITAKHGQSPIDTNRFQKIGKGITTTPADVIAGFLPPVPAPENPNTPNGIGPTQDDISLMWLAPGANLTSAVSALEASGTAGIGLGQIFYGPSLETMFNAPGVPTYAGGTGGDPRTPDIIVQPNVGVIYTGSKKKQAEHGGFANDDTNVMMLVSNPDFDASTVTSFVETTQVAPTILKALGLDPNKLDGVQKEGTPVLPGLDFEN